MNFRPKITESELLKWWRDAHKLDFGDTGDRCVVCEERFFTGDVVILFGDLEASVSKRRSACRSCAMRLIMDGRIRPSGASVYVLNEHKEKLLEELPEGVREMIIEGLTIIDHLAKSFDEMGSSEESPS
jgi:hypothetical protein